MIDDETIELLHQQPEYLSMREKYVNVLTGKVLKVNPRMNPQMVRQSVTRALDAMSVSLFVNETNAPLLP